MRLLVAGERANVAASPRWSGVTATWWAGRCAKLGAFCDARSRRCLSSAGVDVAGASASLNLLPPGRGLPWDAKFAAEVARLLPDVVEWDLLAACGIRVAAALGVRGRMADLAGRVVVTPRHGRVLVVPHPSGLNLWWNCPSRVATLREAVGAVLADTSHRAGETTCRW